MGRHAEVQLQWLLGRPATDSPVWGPGSQGSKLCAKSVLFLFFWPHHVACRIFVPLLGIEPLPLAVEMWSPNYWTTREVPQSPFSKKERPSHQWQQELQPVVTVATIGWTGIYSSSKPCCLLQALQLVFTTDLPWKAALPKGKTICHPYSFLALAYQERHTETFIAVIINTFSCIL